jgi:hypothetical protein
MFFSAIAAYSRIFFGSILELKETTFERTGFP